MASSDIPKPTTSAGQTPVRYMDTAAAYDQWAEVYDTDGNFLQALDTIEMKDLLPHFLQTIRQPKPWKLVDLGCGTGRNLLPLLHEPNARVIGLELSRKMLGVARSRVEGFQEKMDGNRGAQAVELILYDMIEQPRPPELAIDADGLVSTLVLEHIPLEVFFKTASQILREGGVFLVTNMHSEMGEKSQAGFVDPATGEKIRPKSYAHCVDDVVGAARSYGFQLEGDVLERRVDDLNLQALGKRAEKWNGVLVWYGMIFRKTSG